MDKVYCCNCNEEVVPTIRSRKATIRYKGENLPYTEYYCICAACGDEVHSTIIDDVNCLERERVVDSVRRTNALLGWSE